MLPRCLLLLAIAVAAPAQDPREEALVTLDGHFPFEPPASAEGWAERRAEVRRRVLVAAGLWPEIVRVEPDPVIWGPIERDGYTVSRVHLQSLPGFHVTGNLYRPTTGEGPYPAVLSPHGHWTGGRFSVVPDEEVIAQLERGEEEHYANARFHLQARCAQLARMGCVVLHHDMLGYADSRQVEHWSGFGDVEAELWALNPLGLQTRNSVHALDVLLALPDVDPERVAVTGGSGGGTQTFLLGAVDDRPDVLLPAVMVSTAMQGGCVCENASHLRVGTGNVELAALAAPRPLGLTGADDWTREILTDGFPELAALYRTLGVPERVRAWCHPTHPHNFDAVSRGHLYRFLNEHLELGRAEPIEEPELLPIHPDELSVYDGDHPRPGGGIEDVRAALLDVARGEVERLRELAGEDPAEYRRVVGGALATMLDAGRVAEGAPEGLVVGEAAPVRRLLRVGGTVLDAWMNRDSRGVDTVLPFDGSLRTDHRRGHVLFTWGYNRTHLAHRVHDVLRARDAMTTEGLPLLLGRGEEALAALLAAALEPERYARVAVEWRGLDVDSLDHRDFLPGAERWGGAAGYAALIAPTPLLLLGAEEVPEVVRRAYAAAGAPEAVRATAELDERALFALLWLGR